jgi:hypothetical protein
VVGAIEGDKENSKENNRNDALAAQLLEITQGAQETGLLFLFLFFLLTPNFPSFSLPFTVSLSIVFPTYPLLSHFLCPPVHPPLSSSFSPAPSFSSSTPFPHLSPL